MSVLSYPYFMHVLHVLRRTNITRIGQKVKASRCTIFFSEMENYTFVLQFSTKFKKFSASAEIHTKLHKHFKT